METTVELYYTKKQISSGPPSTAAQGDLWTDGVYSLTVTDTNGCQSTATKLITIYELPQGSLLGFKEEGCVPLCGNYIFKANGSNANSSWTINEQVFPDQFNYCFTE